MNNVGIGFNPLFQLFLFVGIGFFGISVLLFFRDVRGILNAKTGRGAKKPKKQTVPRRVPVKKFVLTKEVMLIHTDEVVCREAGDGLPDLKKDNRRFIEKRNIMESEECL